MSLEETLIKYACPFSVGDRIFIKDDTRTLRGIKLKANSEYKIADIRIRPKYTTILSSVTADNVDKWKADPDCFIYFIKITDNKGNSSLDGVNGNHVTRRYDGKSFKVERFSRLDKSMLYCAIGMLGINVAGIVKSHVSKDTSLLKCSLAVSTVFSSMVIRSYLKSISGSFWME